MTPKQILGCFFATIAMLIWLITVINLMFDLDGDRAFGAAFIGVISAVCCAVCWS